MLILICRIRNQLGYLPWVCRIRIHTYALNGAFEDPIEPVVADCGSSGSVEMLYPYLYLSHLLPFFE